MALSSPSPTTSSSSKRPRPKGLWRARVTTKPHWQWHNNFHHSRLSVYHWDSDPENDIDDLESVSSSSKRSRSTAYSNSPDDDSDFSYFDFSRQCSPSSPAVTPDRESCWTRRTRIMDTESTARLGSHIQDKPECTYEDWEDLKDLFNKAAERYENDSASEALPLFRGVVHECHRFLIHYQDPSVIFTTRRLSTSSGSNTPTQTDPQSQIKSPLSGNHESPPLEPRQERPSVELPTAFHAILGTSLFLFGNLIQQDSSLALPGEPDTPIPYWLAALDVFETGENLPSRISGKGDEAPEDWRMAIVWGRTLVCIADETIVRSVKDKDHDAKNTPDDGMRMSPRDKSLFPTPPPTAQFTDFEFNWAPGSPFAAIATRRPPVTRRMSLMSASPNDLMVLAMDQFSRGIFHMPHPQRLHHHAPSVLPSSTIQATQRRASTISAPAPPLHESFSRAKELFTIASEVLLLAEKLDLAAERQYWASWADSVFNQMKMEADMDAWRVPINRARGRCWLIVGSARAEEIEEALERGEAGVWESEEAEEAREGLGKAVEFFERAKGSATAGVGRAEGKVEDAEVTGELDKLLAEALLTLANLTKDEGRREELYKRAQDEGGANLHLDERMDVTD